MENLLQKCRRSDFFVGSSCRCPHSPILQIRAALTRRRFRESGFQCISGTEPLSYDLDLGFNTSEDGLLLERLQELHIQDQLRATFGAGMLAQKKKTSLRPFRCSTISEPCCGRYAGYQLRRNAAHVEDDGADPSRL